MIFHLKKKRNLQTFFNENNFNGCHFCKYFYFKFTFLFFIHHFILNAFLIGIFMFHHLNCDYHENVAKIKLVFEQKQMGEMHKNMQFYINIDGTNTRSLFLNRKRKDKNTYVRL